MMIFKEKRIPKHLIIREDYQLRRKSRFGFLVKALFCVLLFLSLSSTLLLF